MESYTEMLRNFKKINFVLETVYNGYSVYVDYDPRGQFVGLNFTAWSKTSDECLDDFTKSTEELVVSVNEEINGTINLDEVEDFIVMNALFNNQMDKILPNYSHNGWSIVEDGIKEKGVRGILEWEDVEKQLQRPEVKVMDYDDLMTL